MKTNLPAESRKPGFVIRAFHVRLRGGGIGVVNLTHLVGYTVYPGVAQIPADAWMAEPISSEADV